MQLYREYNGKFERKYYMKNRYKGGLVKWMLCLGIVLFFIENIYADVDLGVIHLFNSPNRYHVDHENLFWNPQADERPGFSNVPGYGMNRYGHGDYNHRKMPDRTVPRSHDNTKAYKTVFKETKTRIKTHSRIFEDVQNDMACNEREKEEADRTNDLIERFWRRGKLINKSRRSAKSAMRMRERADFYEANFGDSEEPLDKDGNFYDKKAKEYINYKKSISNELQAIVGDINRKFDQFEHEMSTNDSQIRAADETNDLHERLRVRGDLIEKSDGAASFQERFVEAVKDLKEGDKDKKNRFKKMDVGRHEEKARTYRDYEKRVARDFHDIEGDVVGNFKQIDHGMSSNDEEIRNADASHNLYIRLNIRKGLIEKSGAAADHLEKYITLAEKWQGKAYRNIKHHPEWNSNRFRATKKIYRDYQKKLKRDLRAIEEDIRRQEERERHRGKEKEGEKPNSGQESHQDSKAGQSQEEKKPEPEPVKEPEPSTHEEKPEPQGNSKEEERSKEETKKGEEDGQKENEKNKEPEVNPEPELENFEWSENDEYIEITIDGDQLVEELGNFEGIFNGEGEPNMEAFDRLMDIFLGKGQEDGTFEDIAYNEDFDSQIDFGEDYMIGSYEYRDEKYEIGMDIGRVSKVKKDQATLDDLGGDDVMNIKGIRVSEKSKSIVLTLNNGMEKVIIRSDIRSLEHYAAQRIVEEKIYLRIRTKGSSNVDPENLPIWGKEKKDANWIRKVGSIVADFLPYVGTSKAVSELIFGYDYVGGEDVSRVVAACAVLGSLVPVPGAAKGMKYVGKWVNKVIKNGDLAKKMPTRFHMRTPQETAILRNEFKTLRGDFLEKYANSPEALKRFSQNERNIMLARKLPKGYIIHHKKPLYRGGNNDYSNLRIMKNSFHNRYTKRLHHYEKGKNIYGFD